jgi:hypothetical protein
MISAIVLPAWVFYPVAVVTLGAAVYFTVLFIKQKGK